MFKKLRNQMLILNMIIISIVMLTAFSIIYGLIYTNFQIQNKEELERVRIINIDGLEGLKDLDGITDPRFKQEISKMDKSFNILLNEENEITNISSYLDLNDEEYQDIINNINESGDLTGTITINDKEWQYKKSELANGVVRSGIFGESVYEVSFIDITESQETLQTLAITLGLVGIVTLILIFIISLYFSNKSIKPIEVIWKKQKQFIADATHELKTPLTIINANIDAITVNEESTVKEQEKWIGYIKNETKGMDKLINELLVSAKSEEDRYNIRNENISELISNLILSVETIIFEKNIKLNLDIEKDIRIDTDSEKFRQVILILVDNAIKYTNESGSIDIKLVKDKKNVVFEIENTGEGIEQKDIPHIFDRFYKCDESRTENSYGLGLFIAKAIITKLKGTIDVESIKNEKTKFSIKLK